MFIGHDSRESVASYVAAHSIEQRTRTNPRIEYLKHRDLRKAGLFMRPWVIDGSTGNWVDLIDGRQFSTEFSHTRFLIPHLMNYQGWALFMDADMIFQSNIKKLWELRDDKYAVMCVKHLHHPKDNTIKMDGRLQNQYNRKNWSSFVMWNCSHPSNKCLNADKVNCMKGSDLHAFSWLKDHEIGSLPFSYNYISVISPKRDGSTFELPDVIHYTEGGPWFQNCKEVPYAQLWTQEYEDWQRNGANKEPTDIPTVRYDI